MNSRRIAAEDIAPSGPVSLYGQYYERISEYVQSTLTVTARAIEKQDAAGNTEQATIRYPWTLFTL